jgi:poly-gamma-glutamate synthesis protein (capsule biosynthesis protein)
MVVGHHQHVAAGIEIVEGKPVFYGLGNFLHWGTQNMGRHGMCHDYGLVARVHLSGKPGERLSVKAIEAIPVTDMHLKPQRLDAVASMERVQALNHLNRQFGEQGVRFAVEADGTGLYCAAGAERLTGEIGSRCAASPGYEAPAPVLETRIAAACAKRVVRIVDKAPEDDTPVQVGMLENSVSAADVLQ